jgi:hypothetical protein
MTRIPERGQQPVRSGQNGQNTGTRNVATSTNITSSGRPSFLPTLLGDAADKMNDLLDEDGEGDG